MSTRVGVSELLILVTQQYTDPLREKEFARCRFLNESAAEVEQIEIVDGDRHRWTWGELYSLCCEKFSGKLCVIANSDIAFDATRGLHAACRPRTIVSLNRWEDDSGPRFLGHTSKEGMFFSGTQDAWAFIAGTVPKMECEIPLGVVACDQAVAGWAASSGVRITCPSLTIRTRHIHSSLERPQRPTLYGYFGYPHLTTLDGSTGNILCHHWPSKSGEFSYEWERCRL